MKGTVGIKFFLYFLLFLFFVKPNFDTFGLSRTGDAICILLLGTVYIFAAYKRMPNMRDATIPFAALLFSYMSSIVFCLFNFSIFILSDINEIFRVPLFMILPIFIGKYLVRGDTKAFNTFCRFFVMLYIYNLLIIIFQFFDFFDGFAYTLYAQEGLGFRSSRATGISLFIQECAWIVYTTTAVMVVGRFKNQGKKIPGILLSVPSLLTLSKTVYLSFMFLIFPFSFNKKAKLSFKVFLPSIVLLLIIAGLLFYILRDDLRFVGSILEGFSSTSKSISSRQNQINNLKNSLDANKLGYFFGVMPIFSKLGVRVETSFFNIFAKVGIFGTIAYYCCINILFFVKQKGPVYIILLRKIIMWIGVSLSLVSVTGGSIEGVKGMFFYFLVIGVLFSFNDRRLKHEYSIRRG